MATKSKGNVKDTNVGKQDMDDQKRGTSSHGVKDAGQTGIQTGVPADKATVDPFSDEGKRRREQQQKHRSVVGGPHRGRDQA